MIPYSEFSRMSATGMAARIASRDVSPVELVDSATSVLEQRNPSLNAMVVYAFEQARERALAAEAEVLSGRPLPPMHGVPVAMKDSYDFKPGWPATFGGVPALKDFRADTYCTFARRMEEAGAIILGRTNRLIGWCCTYIQNLTGHYAATVPAGLTDEGLPVGLQIAGRRFSDTDVIAASRSFERAHPWDEIYEKCRSRSLEPFVAAAPPLTGPF